VGGPGSRGKMGTGRYGHTEKINSRSRQEWFAENLKGKVGHHKKEKNADEQTKQLRVGRDLGLFERTAQAKGGYEDDAALMIKQKKARRFAGERKKLGAGRKVAV